MNEIIDYIKDSPIEYAIDALSVNFVLQTLLSIVLLPFILYLFGKFLKNCFEEGVIIMVKRLTYESNYRKASKHTS